MPQPLTHENGAEPESLTNTAQRGAQSTLRSSRHAASACPMHQLPTGEKQVHRAAIASQQAAEQERGCKCQIQECPFAPYFEIASGVGRFGSRLEASAAGGAAGAFERDAQRRRRRPSSCAEVSAEFKSAFLRLTSRSSLGLAEFEV